MSSQISSFFIDLFKSEPCLWDFRLMGTQWEMEAAVLRIAEKLNAVEPGITTEVVCKRIKYLKKVYVHERRRLKQAAESGTDYKPKLWYFEHLSFLEGQPILYSPDARESNAEENEFTERDHEGKDQENLGNEVVPGVLLHENDSSSENSTATTPTIQQVFSLKPPTSGENSETPGNHLPDTKSVHTENQAFSGTVPEVLAKHPPDTKSVHTANQAFPGTVSESQGMGRHLPDTKSGHTANQAFPGTVPEILGKHLPDTKNIPIANQAFPGTEVLPPVQFYPGVYHHPAMIPPTEEELKVRNKRTRMHEDRCEVFGKSIAIRMRGLPKQQMLLAERMINETLFQAETGCLTLNHRLIDMSPAQQPAPQPHPQSQHFSHSQWARWFQSNVPRKEAP